MNRIELISFVVRHALALVFLVAAVGKLRDREGTRRATADLGVPRRLVPTVALALPVAELVVAAGLALASTSGPTALAAATLVAAFSVLVAVQLHRGHRPNCNCFGAGGAPIGPATLVRNALLLTACGGLGVRWVSSIGDADAACRFGCPSDLTTAQVVGLVVGIVVAVVLAAHTWAIVHLLGQRGALIERLDGLERRLGGPVLPSHAPAPLASSSSSGAHAHHRHRAHRRPGPAIGSPAPRFALPDLRGRQVSIDELLDVDIADADTVVPTVLLFLETHCEACVSLAAEIGDRVVSDGPYTDRRLVAVVGGDPEAVAERIDGRGFTHVLVDSAGVVAERYGVAGSPTGLLVLPDGRIASQFAEGRAAVSRLVRPTTSITATPLEAHR